MPGQPKPSQEDLDNLSRLINTGLNNVLLYGQDDEMEPGRFDGNIVEFKDYDFAFDDYRVYDYFKMYPGFSGDYINCLTECVKLRFPQMQFTVYENLEQEEFDYQWHVNMTMENTTNETLEIEIRHVVFFNHRELPKRVPSSCYSGVRIFDWRLIPDDQQ